jgi:hypothetical protein
MVKNLQICWLFLWNRANIIPRGKHHMRPLQYLYTILELHKLHYPTRQTPHATLAISIRHSKTALATLFRAANTTCDPCKIHTPF